MTSRMSTSHFMSAFAARSSILRMRHSTNSRMEWTSKLFRKKTSSTSEGSKWANKLTTLYFDNVSSVSHITITVSGGNNPECVVRQVRQTTWPEVTRLFNTGLAGFWAMAVFLIVGFSACHITGPSVVMSVVITSVAAVLTGKRQARRAKSGKIFAKEAIIAQSCHGACPYLRIW